MCGIIGYIGKREALPIVLEGLTRMEYRGYDSAGVAITTGRDVVCIKGKGKVALLKEKCSNETLDGVVGIGHTRWATHGEPSERNAHPHKDCAGSVFVAHNGIIENYEQLKQKLIKKGHRFTSATDTEVIAHLIEEALKEEKDFKIAVQNTLKELRGTFGVVILSREHPGVLVAARFGSPLILGIGKKEEYVIASDAMAILPLTNSVVYLNDGDMVTLTEDAYALSDFRNGGEKLTRAKANIEWTNSATKLEEFPHFMLKEIMEQPESLQNAMRGRLVQSDGMIKFGGLEHFEERLRNLHEITIVGMGTAGITGIVGEYAIEELAGIRAKREIASEFAFRQSVTGKNSCLIAMSQSGETADTLNAIREAKRRGMLTLGIVNVIGSTIAREVDCGLYSYAGPEIAVASTKAATSQMLLLIMLALYLGRMRGLSKPSGQMLIKEIRKLPANVEKILAGTNRIKTLARRYKICENLFCLGRGYNISTALEGALKLKECAYMHVEGGNTSELKHGPISLIDKRLPSLVIAPKDSLYEKNRSSIEEIKARKGKVIALTTEGNKELQNIADDVLYIPKTIDMLTPILAFVPLQLLAYYLAAERGNDVDKPRNLAKSVTVE